MKIKAKSYSSSSWRFFWPSDLSDGAPAGVLTGTLYDVVSGQAIEGAWVFVSFAGLPPISR